MVTGTWHFYCSMTIGNISSSQLTNSNLFQGGRYTTNQTIFAIVLMGGICTIHRDTVWPGLLHRMCWPTSFAGSPWAYQAPLGCLLLDAADHPMTLKLSDGGPRADDTGKWRMIPKRKVCPARDLLVVILKDGWHFHASFYGTGIVLFQLISSWWFQASLAI